MYSYIIESTKYYFCFLEFEPFSESESTIYTFEKRFEGACLLVSKSVTFFESGTSRLGSGYLEEWHHHQRGSRPYLGPVSKISQMGNTPKKF